MSSGSRQPYLQTAAVTRLDDHDADDNEDAADADDGALDMSCSISGKGKLQQHAEQIAHCKKLVLLTADTSTDRV